MKIIDLHCDTLYRALNDGKGLDNSGYEVLLNSDSHSRKLQCYAIWLPDELSPGSAEQLFFQSASLIKSECERLNIKMLKEGDNIGEVFESSQNSAFFTVENALALNGKTDNVDAFANLGVRMMTLTWNSRNQLGSGVEDEAPIGLTDFGRRAVERMEKRGIIVDISHASEKLFYDVAERATRPFVASHSNSRAVAHHKRNLSDEQFGLIVQRKGIVGLNFHNAFLNSDPNRACVEDIFRHAEHFLSLGGENALCFGSDFDGGVLPRDIKNSRIYSDIYELFLKNNLKEDIVRRIFYRNALNFFENFDNQRIM